MRIKQEHYIRASRAWQQFRTRHLKPDANLLEAFAEILSVDSAGMDSLVAENIYLRKKIKELEDGLYIDGPDTLDELANKFDGLEDAVEQALAPGGFRMGPGETIPGKGIDE